MQLMKNGKQKLLRYESYVDVDGNVGIDFQMLKSKTHYYMQVNQVTGNVDKRFYRHPARAYYINAGTTY